MRLTADTYREVRARLAALGHAGDWEWSQNLKPPATAEDFACEFTWVVLNSGMRNTVARGIMDRVWPALKLGRPVIEVFKHLGKAGAIEFVWSERVRLFEQFQRTDDVLDFCHGLPWIGPITKYHLAKNLGADVAKPDRWLVRLAEAEGETVVTLCQRLAREVGDRIATVDVVLWRACAVGLLKVADGEIAMEVA